VEILMKEEKGMKQIRKKQVFFVGMILMAVFIFGIPEAPCQQTVKLKFASVMAPPGMSPSADVAASYQKEVTRRTKGAVTFENH
jgi:TRAP-type C4-dicarboxylate transport system substrate-binding protein